MSGNTLVVGAPYAAVAGNIDEGAAYVFTGSGSSWTETAKLTAFDSTEYDYFGSSVSISGNTVVVGAWGGNNGRGTAYVFVLSGSSWVQAAELTASDGVLGDEFGRSVSISVSVPPTPSPRT